MNNEDFVIPIGKIRYYINGDKKQRMTVKQSLSEVSDPFATIIRANDSNCLMRAEAIVDDAVTSDTVTRLNALYLSEGRYLMPK